MRKSLSIIIISLLLTVSLQAQERKQLHCLSDIPKKPRFKITDRLWPETYGDMHVCLWKDDKLAAFTQSIDDNQCFEHKWWMETGEKLGMKFTWFTIVVPYMYNYDGSRGNNQGYFGNLDVFSKLLKAGHEVQAHGTGAENKMPPEGYEKDLKFTRDKLNEIEGNDVKVYAYPYGDSSGHKREIAGKVFIAARGTQGHVNPANRIDYLNVCPKGGNETVDSVLNPKSKEYRAWICTFLHTVASPKAAEAEKKAAYDAKFRQLQYVKSKEDDIWITVFRKVALYGQERDTNKLTPGRTDPDTITFSLSDDMDDSIFQYPLSVKITLDSSWDKLKAVQAGRELEARIILHDGKKFALVNAVPDQGDVTVSKIAPTAVSIPLISPKSAGKRFKNSVTVTIESVTSEAAIHYTLDGSEPTAQSTLYKEPVILNEEKAYTVKAIAVKSGLVSSPVSSDSYKVWLDRTPPELRAAFCCGEAERLYLSFSEKLDKTSAETAAHYSGEGLEIGKAELMPDGITVVLSVKGLKSDGDQSVQVSGITDTSGNTLSPSSLRITITPPASKEEGLIAYYPFDEPSGATVSLDSSGTQSPAELSGAVIKEGHKGNCVYMEKPGDNVYLGKLKMDLKGKAAYSASFWFRYDGPWKGTLIGAKYNVPFAVKNYWSGKFLLFEYRTKGIGKEKGSTEPVQGEWHHLAITAKEGECRGYLDGKVISSVDGKGKPMTYGNPMSLGEGFAQLYIDNLRIYEKALSEEEVATLFAGK